MNVLSYFVSGRVFWCAACWGEHWVSVHGSIRKCIKMTSITGPLKFMHMEQTGINAGNMRFFTRISKKGFAFISTCINLIDVDVFGLTCNILWAILCQKYGFVLPISILVTVFQRLTNIITVLYLCMIFKVLCLILKFLYSF